VINVATGGRISLNELFYAMREVVGGSLEPTYVEAREGDVRDSQADTRKAAAILGYEPIVSFEEGLARTIQWYRAAHAPAATSHGG
jgi:nucleoside-diphosphate-sugar epimerase